MSRSYAGVLAFLGGHRPGTAELARRRGCSVSSPVRYEGSALQICMTL